MIAIFALVVAMSVVAGSFAAAAAASAPLPLAHLDSSYSATIDAVPVLPAAAYAARGSNAHLLVSAENPESENRFAGSMVIEVVVTDPALSDTGGGAGEPLVTVNGATLRMAQAGNGYWYGYFANVDAARYADQIYHDAGAPGQGLDFGVFCSPDTPEPVLGTSFSDSGGVAVPRSGGLVGFTNGMAAFSACGGGGEGGEEEEEEEGARGLDPSSPEINNVVRSPPPINRNGNAPAGKIGLDPSAWPVIQLFSFSGDVRVQYEQGGGPQQVVLRYDDEIPSISHSTDRPGEAYPARAEVALYVSDPRLNQDPTDEDSWTFGTHGDRSVFYQAFRDGGRAAANGGPGLVDLYPHLGRLGFDDNGYLEIEKGGVLELRQNRNQPVDSLSDDRGNRYVDIITLVESRPNSGLFESVDSAGASNLRIMPEAGRGTAAVISYNDRSLSILTGSHTASLSLDGPPPAITVDATGWRSGLRIPITLQDQDQNIDSGLRDDLDVFRGDSIIPSIRIGSPLTASGASAVTFYPDSGSFEGGVPVPSSVPDPVSARLHLEPGRAQLAPGVTYEMISVNMGFPASALYDLLIDESVPSSYGTNWVNLDLRSLWIGLGAADGMGGASLSLHFGEPSGERPIMIAERLGSPQGLIQIAAGDVGRIHAKSGTAYLVLDFGPGGGVAVGLDENGGSATTAPSTPIPASYPIVIDFFSFGVEGRDVVNNAIYRLELEETSRNSGVFEGTLEFAAANQLNIDEPEFVRSTTTIGSDIKLITLDRMTEEDGITITYSDLARVGVVIPRSLSPPDTEVRTHSGLISVSTPSGQLRFGTPVTVTLNDPDLNLSADTVEVYRAVDNPRLPSVDTVGSGQHVLLEIKFKDIRYKRCTVNGVQHGGLASTGFALVETGPATGVFEGVFKMPTWMCNKSGTDLISTAGGSMDVLYHDSRDSSGESNLFSLLRPQRAPHTAVPPQAGHTGILGDDPAGGSTGSGNIAASPGMREPSASLDAERITLQNVGDVGEIILSGDVGLLHAPGSALSVALVHPDGTVQEFDLRVNSDGRYGAIMTLEGGVDPQGLYEIGLSYDGAHVDTLSFYVESGPLVIPEHLKDTALEWSAGILADAEFSDVLLRLAKMDLILYDVPPAAGSDMLAPVDGDYDDGHGADGHGDAAPVVPSPPVSTAVPSWLGDVAGWWAAGLVPDVTFVESVQYLLDIGILRIAGR